MRRCSICPAACKALQSEGLVPPPAAAEWNGDVRAAAERNGDVRAAAERNGDVRAAAEWNGDGRFFSLEWDNST